MPSDNRLPAHITRIAAAIRGITHGFDRYAFWIDHPAPVLPVKEIERHCKHLVIIENRSKKFQPLWQTHVELLQPTTTASQVLASAIEKQCLRTRPEYAEMALDHCTKNQDDANTVRDVLLEHVLVPHATSPVIRVENETYYFQRRADSHGSKTPHVVALYADKRSKLPGEFFGSRCSHLEHRFFGSEALSNIGISCIGDFAAFSHESFWQRHLQLWTLPSKADLGRFLNPSNADCSGAALRKRADKFLSPFLLGNALVLQNVRRSHVAIDRILRPIENAIFLPDPDR